MAVAVDKAGEEWAKNRTHNIAFISSDVLYHIGWLSLFHSFPHFFCLCVFVPAAVAVMPSSNAEPPTKN